MTRGFWLVLVLFFSALSVGAGWFAVNAPEASRPSFADLGQVRLAKETPPLPPAPLNRPRDKGFETVVRRPLFTPPDGGARGARQAVGRPAALGPKAVGYRMVIAPVAPVPQADFRAVTTPRAPEDTFQAAFGVDKPRNKQFFGGHLILPDTRASDAEPPVRSTGTIRADPETGAAAAAAAPPVAGPLEAPIPRLRPQRSPPAETAPSTAPSTAAATPPSASPPAPSSAPAPSASAALDAFRPQPTDPVAEAATRYDAGVAAVPQPAGLSPEEEIILLGVLLRRGDDRALVRMANGERMRVRLGDDVAGWKVSSIGEDFIRLSRASQTREIRVPR